MANTEMRKMRGLAKGRFTRICRSIDTAITQSKPIEYVNMLASDLKSACDTVYAKHEEFILHTDGEDEDEEWISTIEEKYDKIREMLMNYKIHANKDEKDASKIQQTHLRTRQSKHHCTKQEISEMFTKQIYVNFVRELHRTSRTSHLMQ